MWQQYLDKKLFSQKLGQLQYKLKIAVNAIHGVYPFPSIALTFQDVACKSLHVAWKINTECMHGHHKCFGIQSAEWRSDGVMFCLQPEKLDKCHHLITPCVNHMRRYMVNQESYMPVNTHPMHQEVISSSKERMYFQGG